MLFRWIRWIKQITRFSTSSCSSCSSTKLLNTVFFYDNRKKHSYDNAVRVLVFLKNQVSHTFLVGFEQKKKMKRTGEFMIKTFPFGGLRSFWSSSHGFSIILRAGQVTVTKEVWPYFTCQNRFWSQMDRDTRENNFFDTFWRVFFICGLYFTWIRPEMHFLRNFWVKNFRMPQKWSFFALNLHEKCISGWFWEHEAHKR